MEKLPTAYEWLKRDESGVYSEMDICQAMVTFAKLHVEKALKEASEQAEICNKPKFSGDYNLVVDEDSILNSYPLSNIN